MVRASLRQGARAGRLPQVVKARVSLRLVDREVNRRLAVKVRANLRQGVRVANRPRRRPEAVKEVSRLRRRPEASAKHL